ncbi:MAG: Haloacid dehalogenase domain protein hydrolase [Ilumatobacteraceae bacterium]|nr:Haloacid dehalogenase domain protein hydrolase [Ilumatobacteraceae bacterium]
MSISKDIRVVGLDADDTLWHSEVYFERTQRRFDELVGRYVGADVDVHAALTAVERRNLGRYGYGIKGFTLSMIECAIEVTGGAIGVEELGQVLAAGRSMLDHPVDLIDGVDDAITALADAGYRLVIVTKGDLHHQEMKVMASGLADRVERVEIVSEKDVATYRRVIASMGVAPEQFAMVGNSVKSDVLPVIEAGGHAVHIPYHITWEAEHADHDGTVPTLTTIRDLPTWLAAQA